MLILPLLGCAIILCGFGYDLFFAGIPYQDPTPELQANWNFHKQIAGLIFRAGGILLLLGLLTAPVVWMRTEKTAPEHANTDNTPQP